MRKQDESCMQESRNLLIYCVSYMIEINGINWYGNKTCAYIIREEEIWSNNNNKIIIKFYININLLRSNEDSQTPLDLMR